MWMSCAVLAAIAGFAPPGSASGEPPTHSTAVASRDAGNGERFAEMFPGVRADLKAKAVEFDATISPMLMKDDRAPLFYLEVIACLPDTREHETLLVTKIRPSHLHAALLAAGFQPGKPGGWTRPSEGAAAPVDPTGDRLRVRFIFERDGKTLSVDPLDWIKNAKTDLKFQSAELARSAEAGRPAPGWTFAGSRMVKSRTDAAPAPQNNKPSQSHPQPGEATASPERPSQEAPAEVYDADGAGTVIGLMTFGNEVIGWSRTISPEAGVQAPEWVADLSKTPPPGTLIRVRLEREGPSSDSKVSESKTDAPEGPILPKK